MVTAINHKQFCTWRTELPRMKVPSIVDEIGDWEKKKNVNSHFLNNYIWRNFVAIQHKVCQFIPDLYIRQQI